MRFLLTQCHSCHWGVSGGNQWGKTFHRTRRFSSRSSLLRSSLPHRTRLASVCIVRELKDSTSMTETRSTPLGREREKERKARLQWRRAWSTRSNRLGQRACWKGEKSAMKRSQDLKVIKRHPLFFKGSVHDEKQKNKRAVARREKKRKKSRKIKMTRDWAVERVCWVILGGRFFTNRSSILLHHNKGSKKGKKMRLFQASLFVFQFQFSNEGRFPYIHSCVVRTLILFLWQNLWQNRSLSFSWSLWAG